MRTLFLGLLVGLLCAVPAAAFQVVHTDTFQNNNLPDTNFVGLNFAEIRYDRDGDTTDSTLNFGGVTSSISLGFTLTTRKVGRVAWTFTEGPYIPSTATLLSAKLGWKIVSNAATDTTLFYGGLKQVVEGSGTGLAADTVGVTWCAFNAQAAGDDSLFDLSGADSALAPPWAYTLQQQLLFGAASVDGDQDRTPYPVTAVFDTAGTGWHWYDVFDLVDAWHRGEIANRCGIIRRAREDSTGIRVTFTSDEASVVTDGPMLVVEWADTDRPTHLGPGGGLK